MVSNQNLKPFQLVQQEVISPGFRTRTRVFSDPPLSQSDIYLSLTIYQNNINVKMWYPISHSQYIKTTLMSGCDKGGSEDTLIAWGTARWKRPTRDVH